MVVERVEEYLKRIKEKDKNIRAFIEVWEDDAIKRAKEIELKKEKGLLYGKIIAIKDNMLYEGKEITCASKILKGHISSYTATAVQRLIDNDAIIIGRTNMDEFAMGSSTENSSYFITRNPINYDYVPGGSSGGSASAVAADFCDIALGSDTGGSIRQPASFCGIYGLKPTYGTVSRYGLVAFASSLDQIGPMSKNLKDLVDTYNAIKGFDPNDTTTYRKLNEPEDKKISQMNIGVIEFEEKLADTSVVDNFNNAISMLSKKAKNIKRIKIPHLKYAISSYYIIASSEASSNLARFDGIRYGSHSLAEDLESYYKKTRRDGFGNEVKRRIILGTYALSAGYYDEYYLKAQKVRRLIASEFDEAFKTLDLLLIPTTPTAAFKIGEKINNPLEMYLSDIFTVFANLCGIAAMNVPYGTNKENLPYGIQLVANRFAEKYLFEVAGEFE